MATKEMSESTSESSGDNINQENKSELISEENHDQLELLGSRLKCTSLNICDGGAMTQTLTEEAERVNYEEINMDPQSNESNTTNDSTDGDHENICKYFLKGTCRFGDKCFNSHCLSPTDTNEHPLPGVQDTTDKNADDSLYKPHKKKKESKIVEHEKPKKKPPMKTATDVINRIQWDKKLNPEDFTVGYLDRFLGIIENSYSSFDWEDITSVDQTILAIPRHRIQYFKYHDEIVWDKNKRLDCVFGSTGSGQTILDIMQKMEQEQNESALTS